MKKEQKTTKELYEEVRPTLEQILKQIGEDPHDSGNRKVALLLGATAMAAETTIPESERVAANKKFDDMMWRARNTPRGAF